MASSSRQFDPWRRLHAAVDAAVGGIAAGERRLLAAVSGGADSTALLLALAARRSALGMTLTVAHVDHRLRPDSAADADWTADLCRRLDLPIVIRRAAPGDLPAADGPGVEAAARRWRRAELAEIARALGAGWVAMAHTADDQAETVLHRLLRGAGLRGLAGIAPRAPLVEGVTILRPWLDIARSEIEAALQSIGQDWRSDPTNADARFTRNRIRRRLLPLLRRQFNPQVDHALCRLATQCRNWIDAADQALAEALAAAVLEARPRLLRLRIQPLAALEPLRRRELLRGVWQRQGWPQQSLTQRHWQALLELVSPAGADRSLTLPGAIQATRRGGVLQCEVVDVA